MPEEDILHQGDVEAVVQETINEDEVAEQSAAIADLASPSVGYVQAEAVAARDKINAILAALRTAGIIDT